MSLALAAEPTAVDIAPLYLERWSLNERLAAARRWSAERGETETIRA